MKYAFAVAVVVALSPAALAATPEQAWRADLAETNKAYAVKPHAILKIQDAVYLGEGNSATLMGKPGKPGTYKWTQGLSLGGVLSTEYQHGKTVILKDGKRVTNPLAAIPVDRNVDIQAFPTQVQAGVMGVRIFVYNQQNPDAKAFKGVDYFPYDASYVVKARFTPDPKLPARNFRTSRGTDKQFFHVGDAAFTLKGKLLALPFYADSNNPKKITALSAFFTDDMTGKGTYGAGRYVDIEGFKSFPPRAISIDFNYAYNPNCARSAFYTCPIALDRLALAIKAGERDPHAKH